MTTTGSNCSNNNSDMLTTEKPQNANNNHDDKESNSNKCHMNESYKKTCFMADPFFAQRRNAARQLRLRGVATSTSARQATCSKRCRARSAAKLRMRSSNAAATPAEGWISTRIPIALLPRLRLGETEKVTHISLCTAKGAGNGVFSCRRILKPANLLLVLMDRCFFELSSSAGSSLLPAVVIEGMDAG
ncbi:hypothetical protein ACLKA7_009120 [Drosophila subpalustris]